MFCCFFAFIVQCFCSFDLLCVCFYVCLTTTSIFLFIYYTVSFIPANTSFAPIFLVHELINIFGISIHPWLCDLLEIRTWFDIVFYNLYYSVHVCNHSKCHESPKLFYSYVICVWLRRIGKIEDFSSWIATLESHQQADTILKWRFSTDDSSNPIFSWASHIRCR